MCSWLFWGSLVGLVGYGVICLVLKVFYRDMNLELCKCRGFEGWGVGRICFGMW